MRRGLAVAIDEVGFAAIQSLLGLRNRLHFPDPDALDALRRGGSPLADVDPTPPPVPAVELERGAGGGGTAPDYTLRFASPRPSGYAENDTAYLDLYLPANGWGRGLVIEVPGVFTGTAKLNERPFRAWARGCTRRGLTCAFYHPPMHMRRRLPGKISGELMMCGDVFASLECYLQAVADLRAAVSWALTVSPRVGYCGASMGAVIGLPLVAREPRLACAVLIAPAVDMAGPVFRSTLCAHVKEPFIQVGGTPADLHALQRPLDPFTHPPAIARDRLLLIEALYDQVCYPDDLERLWHAWDHPPILRYPHGHLSLFGDLDVYRAAGRFLASFLTGAPVETPLPVAA